MWLGDAAPVQAIYALRAPTSNLTSRTARCAGPAMSGGWTPVKVCRVDGCGTSLDRFKRYFQRCRICEDHFRATEVLHQGQPHRFCQQHARLEPLALFEGLKKSCSQTLARHSVNLRNKRAANAAHRLVSSGCRQAGGWQLPLLRARQLAPAPAAVRAGLLAAPAWAHGQGCRRPGPR